MLMPINMKQKIHRNQKVISNPQEKDAGGE